MLSESDKFEPNQPTVHTRKEQIKLGKFPVFMIKFHHQLFKPVSLEMVHNSGCNLNL